MNRGLINWQYCSNPNDVNDAILNSNPDWVDCMMLVR